MRERLAQALIAWTRLERKPQPIDAALVQRVADWKIRETNRVAKEQATAAARAAFLQKLDALEEGTLSGAISKILKGLVSSSNLETLEVYARGIETVKAKPTPGQERSRRVPISRNSGSTRFPCGNTTPASSESTARTFPSNPVGIIPSFGSMTRMERTCPNARPLSSR